MHLTIKFYYKEMKILNNTMMNVRFYGQFSPHNNKENNNSKQRPVLDGLTTAGSWFGFGVGLDTLSKRVHFTKSPTTNSVLLNGAVGLGAGAVTACHDVFVNKNNTNRASS